MDIVAVRINSQHLSGSRFESVEEAVAHFGAVQAQDYVGAAWALSLRLDNSTKADIDQAYNTGKILRTHVLRPTWHFVLPEDVRWMTELTSPRIKLQMSYYNRKLELDEKFFVRSHRLITEALNENKFLTRAELAQKLADNGIDAKGQRLAHIVMQAEIDGLICSGPFRGKQFTYALTSERAPNAKNMSREESLTLLAKRYFTSHGPATLKDFIWWSGLTAADSKLALNLCKDKLNSELFDSKEYWFASGPVIKIPKSSLLLLSVYDEYVIAYADYSPIFINETKSLTNIIGNARLNYVIVVDGKIVGSWRRVASPGKIIIETKLKVDLSPAHHVLLILAAKTYSKFINLPVEVLR